MPSPIDRARKSLVEVHQIDAGTATLAIHVLLDELSRPDPDMLRAGAEELRQTIPRWQPAKGFDGYIRDLADVVFHAMLARADR